MQTFAVSYQDKPWLNRKFKVRGVCKCDVLNPCWDNRKTDVVGQHWGGGSACQPCIDAAKNNLK
jgi:hypothetical protein